MAQKQKPNDVEVKEQIQVSMGVIEEAMEKIDGWFNNFDQMRSFMRGYMQSVNNKKVLDQKCGQLEAEIAKLEKAKQQAHDDYAEAMAQLHHDTNNTIQAHNLKVESHIETVKTMIENLQAKRDQLINEVEQARAEHDAKIAWFEDDVAARTIAHNRDVAALDDDLKKKVEAHDALIAKLLDSAKDAMKQALEEHGVVP